MFSSSSSSPKRSGQNKPKVGLKCEAEQEPDRQERSQNKPKVGLKLTFTPRGSTTLRCQNKPKVGLKCFWVYY